jgi:hypothetical protein
MRRATEWSVAELAAATKGSRRGRSLFRSINVPSSGIPQGARQRWIDGQNGPVRWLFTQESRSKHINCYSCSVAIWCTGSPTAIHPWRRIATYTRLQPGFTFCPMRVKSPSRNAGATFVQGLV